MFIKLKFEKSQTKTQTTKKQKAQRQGQTKSKELHSETKAPWYLRLWWVWLGLVVVGYIVFEIYLKPFKLL